MAIRDQDVLIDLKQKRRKIPDVDNPVLIKDHPHMANGRSYQSHSFTTPIPEHPRVLPEARGQKGNYELMVSINVEPCDSDIPNLEINMPYEFSVQYFNRTNRAIKVTDKHNITVSMEKPMYFNPLQDESLIIRKIHRFNNTTTALSVLYNDNVDRNCFSVEDGEREQIINRINEMNRQGMLKNYGTRVEIKIDRIIPISLLNEYASIYVSDVDLLFRFDGVDIGTPHPTSQDAVIKGEIIQRLGDRRVTGAFYEIIDNESNFSSRYVCLGKTTVQIPINRNPGKQTGIYYTQVDNVNVNNLRITLNHCPLEDAEALGIYQTKEEAETKGRVNESFKLELASLQRDRDRFEHEATVAKTERQAALDELEHQRRMEKLTLEQQGSQLTHTQLLQEISAKLSKQLTLDQLEQQAAFRKDHFESRSSVRRDTSEIFKWAPTIVSSVIGAVGIGVAIGVTRETKKKGMGSLMSGFSRLMF